MPSWPIHGQQYRPWVISTTGALATPAPAWVLAADGWRGTARVPETRLTLANVTYEGCPYIQMSMSIAHKHDEPQSVLFAVGMNDCEAQIVTMAKRDMLALLFARPAAKEERRGA